MANPIATTLRGFIRENFLFGDEVPFSDQDSFLDLGIIDSTGVLELVDFIQRTWGLEVDDEDLVPENLDSVDNLVRFIQRKQSSAAPASGAGGRV